MLDLTSLSKAQLIELVRLALSRGTLLDADIAGARRHALRAACGLYGGIRPFVRQARQSGFDVDASNLSRWLSGHAALSTAKVDQLLVALGLPDMQPRGDIVHVWRPHHSRPCDLAAAFSLYFQAGASVALVHASKTRGPSLHAVHDGRTCALITIGQALCLPDGLKDGPRLRIADPERERWLSGKVSVEAFKAAWGEQAEPAAPSLEDIIEAMQDGEGVSQAVQRLWGVVR